MRDILLRGSVERICPTYSTKHNGVANSHLLPMPVIEFSCDEFL